MGEVIAPLAILAAVIYGFVQFAKMVKNGDWNGVKTQGVIWIASIGGVLLVAETTFGIKIDVYGIALSDLAIADKIVVGLVPAAIGIVGYDVKKALDGSDSSRSLPLFESLPRGGEKAVSELPVFDPNAPTVADDAHDSEDPRSP